MRFRKMCASVQIAFDPMSTTPRKPSAPSLDSGFRDEMKNIPLRFFERLVGRKIEEAGHEAPPGLVEALSNHLLKKPGEGFEWDDGKDSSAQIDLNITNADIEKLVDEITIFARDKVPDIVEDVSRASGRAILRDLEKDWPEQKAYDAFRMDVFRDNLEDRWGNSFDILQMIYTIVCEMGDATAKRWRRSKSTKQRALRDALLLLHARACQVTAEIICLMKNGFADGAMARWRTVHEITVVATLLKEHGNDLAERYWAHEAVEAKRALDRYIVCHEALGYAAPSKAAIVAVEAKYAECLKVYGHNFGQQFGWATHHLGEKKPTFSHLEAAAGEIAKRAHYTTASYNVHATTRGLTSRLGIMRDSLVALAGASNAGFVEPAQNAARSLIMITMLLFGPKWRFDHLVEMRVLLALREKLPKALSRANRELERSHREHTQMHGGRSRKRAAPSASDQKGSQVPRSGRALD
jgi:Family of unknown function (DUF5677)